MDTELVCSQFFSIFNKNHLIPNYCAIYLCVVHEVTNIKTLKWANKIRSVLGPHLAFSGRLELNVFYMNTFQCNHKMHEL